MSQHMNLPNINFQGKPPTQAFDDTDDENDDIHNQQIHDADVDIDADLEQEYNQPCPLPVETIGQDVSIAQNGGVFKKIITQAQTDQYPPQHVEVEVHYKGTLLDGTKFDSSWDRDKTFTFEIGRRKVIKGWDEGVASMKKGEKALLTIRPDYGYGKAGSPPIIPPAAWLQFEVELIGWDIPSWKLTKEQKQERALAKKESGNAHFKAGRMEEALADYRAAKALADNNFGLKGHEEKENNEFKATLLVNMAACCLKKRDFPQAVSECDSALKFVSNHPKALFRRGVALIDLQEYERAKIDLDKALELAKAEGKEAEIATIRKELARLKSKQTEAKEKERKTFGGWLNKLAAVEETKAAKQFENMKKEFIASAASNDDSKEEDEDIPALSS